jgi:hypothetical protein
MLRIRFAILAAIVCMAPAASAQIVRVVLNDTIQPITKEVIDRAIDM